MQIVSKWHDSTGVVRNRRQRVERITQVQRAKSRRDEAMRAASGVVPGGAIVGHTLIAAQVVATRALDDFELSFDASNQLAGRHAYEAALERKIHRMEQGSFYREAV